MAVLYGALQQADLAAERVTEVGVGVVMDAVRLTLEEHNRQLDALMSLFVRRTTDFKSRYQTAGSTNLQPLDENGRALPVKISGYYDVGWPIYGAGTAWAINYITSQKITVAELARQATARIDADSKYMSNHILAGLFYKNSTNPWTFIDPEHGTLSIYGLANGDSIVYAIQSGADTALTDDHLLFDASVDADTFRNLRDELMEHPENMGEVVAFIPTNLRDTVEALATFYPRSDPHLREGVASTVLTGTLSRAVPGEVIGYCEGCWVVEWKRLPDNYIIGVTTEGERALSLREDPEPSLRGFKLVAERDDYPWWEAQFLRRAGFGAWNRVGAVVVRVNSSYAIPTGFESPLA